MSADLEPAPYPLRLLTVHAHPDDESSKGAATVAKYRAEGIPATLVCCTGGEAGDILNPAMDRPEIRERLPEVRLEELAEATRIIGYETVELLGYRDSGMPDSEANAHPDAFVNAPFEEPVERLARILRRERPQVVITYPDDQRGYPHPDHLRVHDITMPAVERAADPAWGEGEPWQVAKVYYSVWSKRRIQLLHEKYLELQLESPYSQEWLDRPWQDHRITTMIDIEGYADVRFDALLAHATQIDPESPFWFGLPRDVQAAIHPYDDYILAYSTVGPIPEPDPEALETDLYEGLR